MQKKVVLIFFSYELLFQADFNQSNLSHVACVITKT